MSSNSLSHFQETFKDLITTPHHALTEKCEANAHLFADNGIPPHEGISVYHTNVLGSLTNTILDHYPMISALTGEEFAQNIAKDYVIDNLPSQGCLNSYGQDYPAYIAALPHAQDLPFLPEVAQLEAAMSFAYNADNDKPLTPQNLAAIAPDDLPSQIIKLRSSATLMKATFDLLQIKEICTQVQNDQDPTDLSALETPLDAPIHILTHRPALEVIITPISADEHHMLSALNQGQPLSTSLEATIKAHPHFDLQAFLQKHLSLQSLQAATPS